MTAVLIVEDEARIAAFLEKGLNANGMSTVVVADGFEALTVASRESFDLVLLDLGLPTMDGTAVLRELRRRDERLPVIVLTARDDPADVVAGLDAGANDYVTKPFSFEELLARVRVQLRTDRDTEPTTLEHAGLALDLRTRRAHVSGRTVELTAREFALAEAFLRHPDQVLSRDQLLALVWGFDHDPGSNVVDVYVRYLRRKLGADRISTVRGMGYRLHAPDEGTRHAGHVG